MIKRRAAAALLTLAGFALASLPAAADYYITGTELDTQDMPKAYTVDRVLSEFDDTPLKNPADLFIDKRGYLYLLDTDNNRLLVLDEKETLVRVVSGRYGEGELPLNKPQGVFVDGIGDIFIADTGNGRVVHLTADGAFVEEFVQPTEDTYDTSYPFKPTKVLLDDRGRLYILNAFDWHGIVVLDGGNRFLGYLCSSKVQATFSDWFVRLFATEAQKEQLARETPPYFSNFFIDEDNMLYTTSYWEDTQQIRKLTTSGVNVFPGKIYGETNAKLNFNYRAGLTDIAADENGIAYAADMVTGKIYVYNQEGDNLAVFGGEGRREGRFDSISSLAYKDGELYVLDGTSGVIQVFRPTALMRGILTATTLYNEGKYEEAIQPWEQVLELDSTNILAGIGMAKVAYRKADYATALELYENAFDKAGYSTAFGENRLSIVRSHFTWVALGLVAAAVGLLIGLLRLKRYADRTAKRPTAIEGAVGAGGYVRLGILTLFHPIEAFDTIKANRKKLSVWPVLILAAALIGVRVAYIYLLHFPLTNLSMIHVDKVQQVALLIIPIASWVLVSCALTAISDGKQTVKEALTASLYAFLPYILFTLPLGLLSHLLSAEELALYNVLTALVMVWSVLLLLLSGKVQNQYSFGKMTGMVLKTLFGVLCLWMICLLFYIVLYQSVEFVKSLYTEFSLIVNA